MRTPIEKSEASFSLEPNEFLFQPKMTTFVAGGTLRTPGNLELHLVVFVKDFKSIPLNGGEVNEDIISIFSGNEPITLLLYILHLSENSFNLRL